MIALLLSTTERRADCKPRSVFTSVCVCVSGERTVPTPPLMCHEDDSYPSAERRGGGRRAMYKEGGPALDRTTSARVRDRYCFFCKIVIN